MVTAFEYGAHRILPMETVEGARDAALKQADAILAGERHGNPPEGFDWGNSPMEFRAAAGRTIVMTTTNGTRGILRAAGADRVWIGAFRNLSAVAAKIVSADPAKLFLLAAGTGPELGLEDVLACGKLCDLLGASTPNDSVRLALHAWKMVGADLEVALRDTDNGQALISAGRDADIAWAAQTDTTIVVPEFSDGAVGSS